MSIGGLISMRMPRKEKTTAQLWTNGLPEAGLVYALRQIHFWGSHLEVMAAIALSQRKFYGKGSTDPLMRIDLNLSPMIGHDPIGDR
jgi:hypothetical protein